MKIMKVFFFIGFCLFLISCSDGDRFNRGYVISKTQVEKESEAPSSEED